jgi:hypothetical protein
LDERFFGVRAETDDACERWRTRVGILSPEEKEATESFVGRKMEEGKERNLVDRGAGRGERALGGGAERL